MPTPATRLGNAWPAAEARLRPILASYARRAACDRYDQDDALAAALEGAWIAYTTYDPARADSLDAWVLYRARQEVLHQRRSALRGADHISVEQGEQAGCTRLLDALAASWSDTPAERDAWWDLVLSPLTREQREATEMYYRLDLEQPEIAAALGVTQASVSRRLSRALEVLRRHWPWDRAREAGLV